MRWTSIYKKNLFSPRDSAEKGPPYKEYLLSVKQHITDWVGKRMSAPCSQHLHPCLVLGKAVPVLSSTLQKGEELLPRCFPSPVPLVPAQYVQPWPVMAGLLNRLLLTASWFLHLIWALECNSTQLHVIPRVISVRTPNNIKGARFNPQHAYFSYRTYHCTWT